jgi:hypothetical protein
MAFEDEMLQMVGSEYQQILGAVLRARVDAYYRKDWAAGFVRHLAHDGYEIRRINAD